MKSNERTSFGAAFCRRQSGAFNTLWRWAAVLIMLAAMIMQQPAMVQGEENAVDAGDAAGDSGWYITTIRKGAVQGQASKPSLGIDPVSGRAFISFYEAAYNHLLMAYEWPNGNCGNNNGWSCYGVSASGINNAGGDYNALAFDPSGNLTVIYTKNQGAGDPQFKIYRREAGFGAETQQVYTNSSGGAFAAPVVRWRSASNSMEYAFHENSILNGSKESWFFYAGYAGPQWIESAQDNSWNTNGVHSSLDFDASGRPFISYRGENGSEELWMTKTKNAMTNCRNSVDYQGKPFPHWACFRIDPNDKTGFFTSIRAPQAAGEPVRIAYMDRGNGLLKFAEQVGGNSTCGVDGTPGWKCSVIDGIGAEARGTQLFVQNGRAVIVYHDANDAGNEKLKIARQLPAGESGNCGPSDGFLKTWQCSVIDSGARTGAPNKNVGRYVSAAIDKTGRVVAAYTTTDGDLVIAKEKYASGLQMQFFGTDYVAVDQTAFVQYIISNQAGALLTEVAFLHSGAGRVSFVDVVAGDACGGTVTMFYNLAGQSVLKLQGATLPPNGTCTIYAHVKGLTPGVWTMPTKASSREAMDSPPVAPAVLVKYAQTINFPPLPGRTLGDAPFTVSATASSGLPVTFTSQTLDVCTVNSATVTMLTAGYCSIKATQAGNDTWFGVATYSNFMIKQNQAISFAPLPNRTLGDAPFMVAASASSGLPVTFIGKTPAVCTVSGATVTLLAAGSCTVRARQTGNDAWNAAPPVDRTFTVNPANPPAKQDQTISFAPLPDRTLGDAPFMVAASASSGLPVAFIGKTPAVCTVSGATVTLLAAGSCTVRAKQTGNDAWNAAPPVDRTFTVNAADPSAQALPAAIFLPLVQR